MSLRVIDAHSGQDVVLGRAYDDWQVLDIKDRFLRAWAKVRRRTTGEVSWREIPVRFMHPSFMFQRVAFLPT